MPDSSTPAEDQAVLDELERMAREEPETLDATGHNKAMLIAAIAAAS